MNKDQSPKLSGEQARVIATQVLIAAADALQNRQPSSPSTAKPKWVLFVESAGGAALITVLLGGILGGIITAIVQENQKDREFQQAWLKARGDIALANSKEYQDKELEVVNQSIDLLGRCITVSDDLVYLTSPAFDPSGYEDSVGFKNQRLTMLRSYNSCTSEWRQKREKLKLLMSYYHHGHPDVTGSWQGVEDSATAYMKCAHKWYLDHSSTSTDTEGICKIEREVYSKKVDQLNMSFTAARRYLWEGWESPQRLRDALNKRGE